MVFKALLRNKHYDQKPQQEVSIGFQARQIAKLLLIHIKYP